MGWVADQRIHDRIQAAIREVCEEVGILPIQVAWLDSGPFDCGSTVRSVLLGMPSAASEDAAIAHPNPVCIDANALGGATIADARDLARKLIAQAGA